MKEEIKISDQEKERKVIANPDNIVYPGEKDNYEDFVNNHISHSLGYDDNFIKNFDDPFKQNINDHELKCLDLIKKEYPKMTGAQIVDKIKEEIREERIENTQRLKEKNKAMCERLNNGEHFYITLGLVEWDEYDRRAYGNDEEGYIDLKGAWYAWVHVGKDVMPFPILEQAIGRHLEDQDFVKLPDYLNNLSKEELAEHERKYNYWAEPQCSSKQFEGWLKSMFNEQFEGVCERESNEGFNE